MGVRMMDNVNDLTYQDSVFSWKTIRNEQFNVRRVADRNTPSAVNAGFFIDQFWDGRANHVFNGHNPSGYRDTDSVVKRNLCKMAALPGDINDKTKLLVNQQQNCNGSNDVVMDTFVRIPMLPHASQAVGPPLSQKELTGHERNWAQIADKLLNQNATPLALQKVHNTDSVLGTLAMKGRTALPKGLNTTYQNLIRAAFKPEWIEGCAVVEANGPCKPLIELNFPLIFGIATAMYQNTLVADDTPFDKFFGAGWDHTPNGAAVVNGLPIPVFNPFLPIPRVALVGGSARNWGTINPNPNAMTMQQKRGFLVYQQAGCVICHVFPETSNNNSRLAGFAPAYVNGTNGQIPLLPTIADAIIDPNLGTAMPAVAAPPLTINQQVQFDPTTGLDTLLPGQVVNLNQVVNNPLNPFNVIVPNGAMEQMAVRAADAQGNPFIGVYDVGFYNLGVRPTEEDIGRGRTSTVTNSLGMLPDEHVSGGFKNTGLPLSYTEQAVLKLRQRPGFTLPDSIKAFVPDFGIAAPEPPPGIDPLVDPVVVEILNVPLPDLFGLPVVNDRVVTRGAFKTSVIRNQLYQGPYFHNGGDATLRHVVEFYARSGNFPVTNLENLTGDMLAIPMLDVSPAVPLAQRRVNEQNIKDLVAFLADALVDNRVARNMAPFDHPEILIPTDQTANARSPDVFTVIPAVGRSGGGILSRFLGLNPQAQ